jgi:SPP1 family predicted phage head-tail adaptor
MQAGRIRHRVTIQQQSVSQNAYNEEVVTWVTLASVWAELAPARGQERLIALADQVQSSMIQNVRIRYRSDVTPKMRISYGSRILDIETVEDPDGRRRRLLLMCREVLNG